jgi:hypothetical protein
VDQAVLGDAAAGGVVTADLDARRLGVVDDDGEVAGAQADRRQGEPQRAVRACARCRLLGRARSATPASKAPATNNASAQAAARAWTDAPGRPALQGFIRRLSAHES